MTTFGTSTTQMTLKFLDRTRPKQMDMIRNEAWNKKEIAHFQDNIKKVNSVDDLMRDHRLYSFVMRAFDLEDRIPHKALMRKLLESEVVDPDSLANRVKDPKQKDLAHTMGFMLGGKVNLNVLSKTWRDGIVERFLTTKFERKQGETNEAVENALYFKRKLGDGSGVRSWYSILGDKKLYDVMQTTLGFPREIAFMDIEKQKQYLDKKYDVKKLKDPKEIERLVNRYAAMKDVEAARNGGPTGTKDAGAANPVLQMVTQAAESFWDIQPVSYGSARRYW